MSVLKRCQPWIWWPRSRQWSYIMCCPANSLAGEGWSSWILFHIDVLCFLCGPGYIQILEIHESVFHLLSHLVSKYIAGISTCFVAQYSSEPFFVWPFFLFFLHYNFFLYSDTPFYYFHTWNTGWGQYEQYIARLKKQKMKRHVLFNYIYFRCIYKCCAIYNIYRYAFLEMNFKRYEILWG